METLKHPRESNPSFLREKFQWDNTVVTAVLPMPIFCIFATEYRDVFINPPTLML